MFKGNTALRYACLLAWAASACSCPSGTNIDGGGPAPDAGGAVDAGPADAGRSDAGADAGRSDAGGADGGTDAGAVDAGYPIHHIIVIVKENHTFDNYFGTFPGAVGTTTCKYSDGGTFPCPRAPDSTPRDLNHGPNSAHLDWNHGGMDGYDKDPNNVYGADGGVDNLAYAQFHECDIPNYWQYARHYGLADHFYSGYMGESFPGHLIVLAAQAAWATDDPDLPPLSPYWGCDEASNCSNPDGGLTPVECLVRVQDQQTCTISGKPPCFNIPSIPDVLPQGVRWKFYGSNIFVLTEIWSMFDAVYSIRTGPGWANVVTYNEFENDLDAGTLPEVSWLVNQDLFSEHPPLSVCAGENWTVQRINEVMASKYWKDTAILFTMDDFGGWYDHVPQPTLYGCDANAPYGLGMRLPLIIISPYAKQGVFSEVSEHASIPHFIERIFGAQPLSNLDPNARDGQANDLLNAFDFNQTPLPPLVLQQRDCLLPADSGC